MASDAMTAPVQPAAQIFERQRPMKSSKLRWRTWEGLSFDTGRQLGLVWVTIVLTVTPVCANPVLHIATWDLSGVDKTVFAPTKRNNRPTWRHTFGAERYDRKKRDLGVFNLDVDVVLLQGARHLRGLRRIFPTRDWKLIMSRDYMRNMPALSRLPVDLQDFDIAYEETTSAQPVTAIAVRCQRRLRVRGIQHIDVPTPEPGTQDPQTHPPSATAVRINYFGSNVWLLSVAAPIECTAEDQNCHVWHAVRTWQDETARTDVHPVPVVSGTTSPKRSENKSTDQAAKYCGDFKRPQHHGEASARIGKLHRLTRKKLGCIVLTTLDIPRARLHKIPARLPHE